MDQGTIVALYQSFRDAAEQESNIDALYQSFKAAEQRRTDVLCQNLRDAAEQGSIDALYALIRTNSDVLDIMDKIPIVETPLHIAASLGHTEFAMEIMKLKPSFARKLNQDGFTPMHLALQKLHELHELDNWQRNKTQLFIQKEKENQTQLVDRLLDVDSDLVRVQGREGVTPFHYVTQIGNLDFLKKFYEVCPKSLEDVTIRRENVLHVALKYDQVEAFRHLLEWPWEEKLLNCPDEEHNTLLHVAVSKNQPEVVSRLLKKGFVDLHAKNLGGETVFDILGQTEVDIQRIRDMLIRSQRSHQCLTRFNHYMGLILLGLPNLADKLGRFIRRQQGAMKVESRNALLVVAALLITVTYQAALGPDQQPNQFNCTAPINATGTANHNNFNCTARFNANSTEVHSSPHQGVAFYVINTLTYYLTNVTLLFLLPSDFIGIVLYYLLGLLFLCYCISTPLLNAPLVSTVAICVLPTFPLFASVIGVFTTDSRGKQYYSLLLYVFFLAIFLVFFILKTSAPTALTYE